MRKMINENSVVDGVSVNVHVEYVPSNTIDSGIYSFELSYCSQIRLQDGDKLLIIYLNSLESVVGTNKIDLPSNNLEESYIINKLVRIYKVMDINGIFNLGKVTVEYGKIFCGKCELFEVSESDFHHNRIEELCTTIKLKLEYIKHTEQLEREYRLNDIATRLSGYDYIIKRMKEVE